MEKKCSIEKQYGFADKDDYYVIYYNGQFLEDGLGETLKFFDYSEAKQHIEYEDLILEED